MSKIIITIMAIAFVAQSTYAAEMSSDPRDKAGPLRITGWGANTCGDYLQKPELKESILDWTEGFISGVNWADTKNRNRGLQISGSPHEAYTSWLQKYCRDHPLDPIFTAASELVKTLERR